VSEASAFERAMAFDRGVFARTAERVERWQRGTVLISPSFPRLWDSNHVMVDDAAGLSAEELVAAAEPLQRAAGFPHRQLRVDREDQGATLAPGFSELGWMIQRHCFMVHRRAPDRPSPEPAAEVTREAIRPAQEEYLASEPMLVGQDDVRLQIIAHAPRVEAAVAVRYFGAPADGPVLAYAKLYSRGGIGQVEDVATVPRGRGRGLARAAVLAALEASRAEGNDLTFLVADEDDWPKELYAKLGFDRVGRIHKFLLRDAPE
jgi:ribosomal protein S18 acetylase RimI-like enzyme